MLLLPKGINIVVGAWELRQPKKIQEIVEKEPENVILVADRSQPRFVVVSISKWEKMCKK